MTTKLYYEDVYLQDFTAQVLEQQQIAGNKWAIVLDRTAFYPEGGGQSCDVGWINGIPVVDVQEQAGKIIHTISSPLANIAVTIAGKVDWQRRFDHMQQHTGQHILSGAVFSVLTANTTSFHLGSKSSYIDVAIDNITKEQWQAVEQTANHSVFMASAVKSFFIETQDFAKYNARKSLAKDYEHIRLVDIQNIDCCPCGGTHVTNTGEIGLIKILAVDRHNQGIRVEFVCGGRTLWHYDQEHTMVMKLSTMLSAAQDQLGSAVSQLQEKNEAITCQVHTLQAERSGYVATLLLHNAQMINNIPVITYIAEDYTPTELSSLGKSCLEQQSAVVLLATINRAAEKVHLYFSCSPDLDLQMNQQLKEVLPLIDGKGGGSKHTAQGGGARIENIQEVLVQAQSNIRKLIDNT